MSKTNINTLVAKIKRRADYNIVDSDLDQLIQDIINDKLKILKQLFLDYAFYDEIGAHDNFATTANQEYVDIATETVDFDYPVILTERTNDSPIEIITFKEYRGMCPDPTAVKAATPDYAAFFANRIYFYPTPSAVLTIYLDYVKLISEVVGGETLPFEDKYDPLLIAMCKSELQSTLTLNNASDKVVDKAEIEDLKNMLIIGASNNTGSKQVCSRREQIPYFSPKKVIY